MGERTVKDCLPSGSMGYMGVYFGELSVMTLTQISLAFRSHKKLPNYDIARGGSSLPGSGEIYYKGVILQTTCGAIGLPTAEDGGFRAPRQGEDWLPNIERPDNLDERSIVAKRAFNPFLLLGLVGEVGPLIADFQMLKFATTAKAKKTAVQSITVRAMGLLDKLTPLQITDSKKFAAGLTAILNTLEIEGKE